MKFMFYIISVAIAIADVMSQEMTIPVGESGLDTLTTIRNFDSAGNYDVGYNENQLTGGASFYREKGYVNGTREGSYGYTTRNGLIRIVTYVADQNGYRAELLTNEPGVGTANPASVVLTKETEPDPAALAQGPTGASATAQSSGNPQQNSGVPQQSSGAPRQSSGAPQQSSAPPQQSYGVPQQNYGIPPQNYGIPQQYSSTPQQAYGTYQPTPQSSVVYASEGDPVRNFVTGPASKSSAEVRVVSPYGQYQYVV